ncbi:hypothetical protein D1AOALGA4SA_8437 [Olavius algarvensis Delta 1 endosymbiont]|nr:hypothetical protein D1AOALGA4SA_8437 [Olavius algarvensis Delta 1 endosymbiont]
MTYEVSGVRIFDWNYTCETLVKSSRFSLRADPADNRTGVPLKAASCNMGIVSFVDQKRPLRGQRLTPDT